MKVLLSLPAAVASCRIQVADGAYVQFCEVIGMDKPIDIEVVNEGDLAIVRMRGDLGLAVSNVDREFTLINASRPRVVILDITDLSFVSSLGMGLFVHLKNTLKRNDGRLFAIGAQRMVLDAFHRSRLDGLFEIRATLEDALLSADRPMPEAMKKGNGDR